MGVGFNVSLCSDSCIGDESDLFKTCGSPKKVLCEKTGHLWSDSFLGLLADIKKIESANPWA